MMQENALTPIAARLANALDEEHRRMVNEWFFKWHLISSDGVKVDGFDGRLIQIRGVKFAHSAREVYWDAIQRYLKQKLNAVIAGVENELPRYPPDVRRRSLHEAEPLLVGFANRIRNTTIEKDRILRGDGLAFPSPQDLGSWAGASPAEIHAQIMGLRDIYCEEVISVEGRDVPLRDLLTDKVSLVKIDGTVFRSQIPAHVSNGTIVILMSDLPIEPGDHLLRALPNGLVDDYVVEDSGYQSKAGGLPGHFQVKVRKSSVPATSSGQTIQHITNNFNGANARQNVNSVDNSVNIIVELPPSTVTHLVEQVRQAATHLPEEARQKLVAPLALLEDEIRQSAPSQSKIGAALQSIRAVAEGVAGNFAAAGISSLIAAVLEAG